MPLGKTAMRGIGAAARTGACGSIRSAGSAVANFHGKLFGLLGVEAYGMLNFGRDENTREHGIDIGNLRDIDPDIIVFSNPGTNQVSHFEIQRSGRAAEWLALDAIRPALLRRAGSAVVSRHDALN